MKVFFQSNYRENKPTKPAMFRVIDNNKLAIGSQPNTKGEINFLRNSGYKTIVSLRSPECNKEEKELLKNYPEIDFIELSKKSSSKPDKLEQEKKFIELFYQEKAKLPVYAHCRCGVHDSSKYANSYFLAQKIGFKKFLSKLEAEITKLSQNHL